MNAPRTFKRRWRGVRPAWLSVARRRMSVLGASVRRHCGMRSCAGSRALRQPATRAWLKPRCGVFRPVQRNGNHQHLGRRLGGQLGDGLGQHPAQPAGRRMQPVVLERVDGLLHAVLVEAEGHGPHKRRRRQAAGAAQCGADGLSPAAGQRASPQRAHKGPLWTGNSVQQASQIGTEESCGRGEPQRGQKAGRRAQPKASMGLRSTRATARQREVSDGGTSSVSEPESLRKTHLT